MKLVFATNNAHKLAEARKILGGKVEVLSLADIGCCADIPETGTTMAENSALKAKYVTEHFGLDCFADDTGFEIDALHGAPGIYAARYAGEPVCSQRNRDKVLAQLQGITQRHACFRTVITLVLQGQMQQFEGAIEGEITEQERGEKGFGYDSIFVPKGYTQTFAELPAQTKNQISHRGLALEKMWNYIQNI